MWKPFSGSLAAPLLDRKTQEHKRFFARIHYTRLAFIVQALFFIDQPCWLLLITLLVMTGVRPKPTFDLETYRLLEEQG